MALKLDLEKQFLIYKSQKNRLCFFSIAQLEEAVYPVSQLQNPLNRDNPMTLAIVQNQTRTAFFTVNSKKVAAEYWDDVNRKKIPNKNWTPEMTEFANQKIQEIPAPAFIFKFNTFGWIFMAAILGVFVYLIYDSVKPAAPMPAEYVSMEKAPQAGDVYFGRFEAYSNSDNKIPSGVGFGWFKITNVDGDTYSISKSTEISKSYKPKEQMNSTYFESNATPAKITEHAGSMLNLKSTDGTTEIYFTDKK